MSETYDANRHRRRRDRRVPAVPAHEAGELAGVMTAYSSGIVRTHYSVPAQRRGRAGELGHVQGFQRPALSVIPRPTGPLTLGLSDRGPTGSGVGRGASQHRHAAQARRGRPPPRQGGRAGNPLAATRRYRRDELRIGGGVVDPYLITTGFIRAARRRGAIAQTATASRCHR
jgi:glycine/D-amino acid oxidase-like deaminating enzyme